ncbi:MAG: RNA methyltransferase, partial [Acidimicrobiia bacterium]|nr:RNA methyltransferase [Acidimicrobiia bacterium]
GRRAWIHEEVVGRNWRISAGSFFQTRPDGAAVLVDVVSGMVGDAMAGDEGLLLDAYCGVGLFAGSLLDGRSGWRAVAVERGHSSVADARINLADLDVKVVRSGLERFRAPAARVVVADPSRRGLGARAVEVLAATGADRFVLISCDAAAAGRDVALLGRAGYRPRRSVVVDLFPHTHHMEIVTVLGR